MNDVEVEVRSRALPEAGSLTDDQKFRKMLENYATRQSVSKTKAALIEACENARVWGGVKEKMNDASVDDKNPLKHIIEAMVSIASHKYMEICRELFDMPSAKISVMAGNANVSSSDVLSDILSQWKTEKKGEATIDALFRACENAGIGGAVQTMFDDIEKSCLT